MVNVEPNYRADRLCRCRGKWRPAFLPYRQCYFRPLRGAVLLYLLGFCSFQLLVFILYSFLFQLKLSVYWKFVFCLRNLTLSWCFYHLLRFQLLFLGLQSVMRFVILALCFCLLGQSLVLTMTSLCLTATLRTLEIRFILHVNWIIFLFLAPLFACFAIEWSLLYGYQFVYFLMMSAIVVMKHSFFILAGFLVIEQFNYQSTILFYLLFSLRSIAFLSFLWVLVILFAIELFSYQS